MTPIDWHIALTFGLLLSAALLAGFLAQFVHLPKVTAYLLVGLLLGPYTAESLPPAALDLLPGDIVEITTIPEEHLPLLDPVAKMAMALVLFNMGCGFSFGRFRPRFRQILRLSLGELVVTFCLVAAGLLVLQEGWQAAVLLAALALATAPATTVLVFKENQSEGPITSYATMLVALNNLACIVVFEALFAAIVFLEGDSRVSLAGQLSHFALELGGSVGLGLLAGLGVSFGCALLARRNWLVMLIAATSLLFGLCEYWELPYLLTFLMMGTTVANTSDRTRDIVFQLDELTGVLCVVFFVIHGAEMDIRALAAAGLVGTAYIVLRLAGKYGGIYLFASRRDGRQMRRWLGATLMSQAGAAIALSAVAAERYPALGEYLLNVILGTVVFFELVGPLLIRQAVVRTGEVPVEKVVHHMETTPRDEVRALMNRFLMAIGRDPWRRQRLGDLAVSDLMRLDAHCVPASATFRRMLEYLGRSHDNTLPVVDAQGAVVGILRYFDLRGEHFDPGLGSLVCAEDLALSSFPELHPEDPLIKAWREFQQCNDDCLPVLSSEEPYRLVGVLRRRDVLRLSPRE